VKSSSGTGMPMDSDRFSTCVVLVAHVPGTAPASLIDLIRRCGAIVRVIDHPIDFNVRAARDCSVAIVSSDAVTAHPASEVVSRFTANGFTVIGYHAQLDTMTLAERCRLLLAGCRAIVNGRARDAQMVLRAQVLDALQRGLDAHDHEHSLSGVMSGLGIVGRSRKMLDIFRQVRRLSALSDLSVLIHGETGTGKELLARALYALDAKRASGPFVGVNCAAITPPLAESELFGHRRGAFTGAERNRTGLIRAAHGGVLFLDEISEMPAGLQPKLLRVLQEGTVLAVGDEREAPVSVRVIAATNRRLQAMVEEGTFRGDLLHRLNVLSIEIPPLRERRDDIPLLVEHFTRKHHSLGATPVSLASADFVDALSRLELPGNARQLENLVRRAIVHHVGDGPLDLHDLPPAVWRQVAGADTRPDDAIPRKDDAFPQDVLLANGWSLSRSLLFCERSMVKAALDQSRGNHSRAARILGITPRSVYNKVRRHRLD
jgi:transcriptional regulator with PAS, ATPase and Fis domain